MAFPVAEGDFPKRLADTVSLKWFLRKQEEGAKCFVFDIGAERFVSSFFLGILVLLIKHEATVLLVSVPEPVREILNITQLSNSITCFETIEEAVEYYEGWKRGTN